METPHEHRIDEDINYNAPELVEDTDVSVGSTDTSTGHEEQELNESTAGSCAVEDAGTGEDKVEADGDCNNKLKTEEYK